MILFNIFEVIIQIKWLNNIDLLIRKTISDGFVLGRSNPETDC